MNILSVVDNPAVSHWIGVLRDKETPSPLFRQAVDLITQSVFLEASRELELVPQRKESPCGEFTWNRWKHPIALIPILRAGLGMVGAVFKWAPQARVLHLGAARDHGSLQPNVYYEKLPDTLGSAHCLILDPMLATGGSAIEAVRRLRTRGVNRITFLGLIGSRKGTENLHAAYPDVGIYLGALDDELNENGYIVPGLGDAGDRFFHT